MARTDFSSNPEATAKLARRFDDLENWTCAIDTGLGARGTGVLVGPDLVLTNCHVIKSLLTGPSGIIARCRFDFRENRDTGTINDGRWVGFADKWCVEESPPSAADIEGLKTGFKFDEVDYAIVRLAERIGEQPVEIPGSATGTAPRGWLPLSDTAELPKPGATIQVFQHPMQTPDKANGKQEVMPLQWADGTVIEYLDEGVRMRHTVTTYKGSSGAPVFDSKFRLVALHNSGDRMLDIAGRGQWNQAIPIAAIVSHLRGRGHSGLISDAPPRWQAKVGVDARPGIQEASENAIIQRLWAASILMDRDKVEDRIIGVRKKQVDNRGMVHVLACRQVDRHQNFLKRLSVVTVDDYEAKWKRSLALLGSGSSQPAGRPAFLEWQADLKETVAFDFIAGNLREIAQQQRRTIVTATVDVGLVKIDRERRMVKAVAALCKEISDADSLQVFVVYNDPSDTFTERRKQLGSLWKLDERPPGCGVCVSLEDVRCDELGAWCEALQDAWKLPGGRMTSLVERVFANSLKMPILNIENGIAPELRKMISARI
ncbi:serine protease [Mesorhizobium sp. M1423]|uniref:trypsin-like serine peptidase n=1 Tax=Mesorhizobium sp. M1423 TaxID=2957101 RepID=UPI00333A9FC8